MQEASYYIIVFLIVVTTLIVTMSLFIVTIFLIYRKKQLAFNRELEKNKINYEKNLLSAKLEIQEQTFLNISREIHDNIGLSLTLAKLYLNTIDWRNTQSTHEKASAAVELLGQSICSLNNISKGLNADIIIQNGLIKALEEEIELIRDVRLFKIDYQITGNPVYMDTQKELIVFRAIQEAFNNILKHANAESANLNAHFNENTLYITISDDGLGFNPDKVNKTRHAGIHNIQTRINMLDGEFKISSTLGVGTTLYFKIPLK